MLMNGAYRLKVESTFMDVFPVSKLEMLVLVSWQFPKDTVLGAAAEYRIQAVKELLPGLLKVVAYLT